MRGVKVLVAVATASVTLFLGWQVVGWRFRRPTARVIPAAVGRVIDEAFVEEHWRERRDFQYDPVGLFVRSPGVNVTWTWEDHPRGKIVFTTNERGFREDGPTPREFDGFRVLVTGDSHTDGVIDNRDSFPNVAERALAAQLGEAVDVINAGVGFTCPRCYLGQLKRCLELRPDVFVAVLFVGNDFADELALDYRLGKRQSPTMSEECRRTLEEVVRDYGAASQGLSQAYRFDIFPGEVEASLEIVLEHVREIDALCRTEGIDFLLVLLPTKMDVDDDDDRPRWLQACADLGLDERAAALNLELGRRVLAAAEERGIDCLDPTEAMRRSDATLYWRKDHHIGYEGHALLGSILAERLRAIHARRNAQSPR